MPKTDPFAGPLPTIEEKMKGSINVAHDALLLAVEYIIDDLIEAGNGLDLDDAWRAERIRDLLDARDRPADFLARLPALPGSRLADWHEKLAAWQAERREDAADLRASAEAMAEQGDRPLIPHAEVVALVERDRDK